MTIEKLKSNFKKVKERVEGVAKRCGRDAKDIIIVAVSKTHTVDYIINGMKAGINIFGENYAQELRDKHAFLMENNFSQPQWHYIGHLQRNKVKKAVKIFDMIETVDSFEIAREIDKRCRQIGKVMPVLIEVNSGGEEQKAGVLTEDAERLVKDISSLQNIKVMGLMTMGPLLDDPEDIRPYFAEIKRLFDRFKALNLPNVEMRYLSMGMTDSYKIAIEEGANMVRIGTRIFGKRPQAKENY